MPQKSLCYPLKQLKNFKLSRFTQFFHLKGASARAPILCIGCTLYRPLDGPAFSYGGKNICLSISFDNWAIEYWLTDGVNLHFILKTFLAIGYLPTSSSFKNAGFVDCSNFELRWRSSTCKSVEWECISYPPVDQWSFVYSLGQILNIRLPFVRVSLRKEILLQRSWEIFFKRSLCKANRTL